MSYHSFSSALPKKLFVIKISDSNYDPEVRKELITASSAAKAVEIARGKWPESDGMMVVDSRELI